MPIHHSLKTTRVKTDAYHKRHWRNYASAFLAVLIHTSVACDVCKSRSKTQTPVTYESTPATFRLDDHTRRALEVRAMAGDNDAAYRLSEHYLMGVNAPGQALEWLEVAATRGDTKSQIALGSLLHVYGNDRDARAWLQKAQQGAALAGDEANRRAAVEYLDEIARNPHTPKSPNR
jgi:TPR repeat protein